MYNFFDKRHLFIAICVTLLACNNDKNVSKELPIEFEYKEQLIFKDEKFLHSIEGDINQDGLRDIIVVKTNVKERKLSDFVAGSPYKRTFIIGLGTKSGNYQTFLKNENVVECIDCSTMDEDAFKGIEIWEDKGFVVKYEINKDQHWKEEKTFIWNAARTIWTLENDIFINYKNSPSDDQQTISYKEELTKEEIGDISILDFNIYNEKRR